MCAGESRALGLAFVRWDNSAVPSRRSAPRPRQRHRAAQVSLRRLSLSTAPAGRRGDTAPPPLSWVADSPVPAHTPASGPAPGSLLRGRPGAQTCGSLSQAPRYPRFSCSLWLCPCPGPRGGPGVAGEHVPRSKNPSRGFSSPLPGPARLPTPPGTLVSSPLLSQSFALIQGFRKVELSRAENRPSLQITGSQEKR